MGYDHPNRADRAVPTWTTVGDWNEYTLIIAERFEFHRRVQKENETVAEYMTELRKLADKCEFGGHLSEALRDRLVCGLRSETTRRRLLTEADLTLAKAYSTAHGMEAVKLRAGELRAPSSEVPEGSNVHYVPGRRKTTTDSARSTTSPSCWQCGKIGHSPDSGTRSAGLVANS